MVDAASTDNSLIDALLDEARIPFAVKAASVSLAGAGLTVALVGLQSLTLVRWSGLYQLAPIALLVFGIVAIAVAAKWVRGRSWTLAAGLASSGLLTAGMLGFVVLSALSGLFTALSILGLGATITSLVFGVLAIDPFRKLVATRKRLRQAGYDVDL